MNRKILAAVLLILTVMAMPTICFAWDLRGLWVAQQMGVRLEATVEQNGNDVSGLALVYSRNGKKDPYHFYGQVQGNKVVASHSDGHVFSGQILNDRWIKGTLKSKGGHKIPVEAIRQ